MGGMDELSEDDKITVTRARKVQKFLSQPFYVAEVFTGSSGVDVDPEDTISGFQSLIEGGVDDLPEGAFYMSVTSARSRPRPLNSRGLVISLVIGRRSLFMFEMAT